MKALKFTVIALAAATSSLLVAAADDDIMNIKLASGGSIQAPVESIDNITFDDITIEPVAPIMINGHECVDLGLPSGNLWATCNLGAASPEDFGFYYAWGELSTKDVYNIFKGDFSGVPYSVLSSNDIVNTNGLTSNYDVVGFLWELPWTIPDINDYAELLKYCSFTWIPLSYDQTPGVIVTGPNGNSIFIPAAGNYHGFQDEHGRYWTKTPTVEDDGAWAFFFNETAHYLSRELRGTGIPIRPVANYKFMEN